MSTPSDDAQRELERRALRNVRGLVDRLEESDEADARTQKRLLAGILIGAVVVIIGIAVSVLWLSRSKKTVTIESQRPAPTQPAK